MAVGCTSVNPNGSRWWRFRYRVQGREKLISLGVYPEISLREARERWDGAKKLHKSGVDPSVRWQIEQKVTAETFEAIASEWFAKFSVHWAPSHSEKVMRRIELDLFPWIGARPIREITAPELLTCLRRIEERGALDTAHRAHQNCGQVFRYAVATGRAERDPSADLRGALPPVKPWPLRKHHRAGKGRRPPALDRQLRRQSDYARGTSPGATRVRAAWRVATCGMVGDQLPDS
jgi:integrase